MTGTVKEVTDLEVTDLSLKFSKAIQKQLDRLTPAHSLLRKHGNTEAGFTMQVNCDEARILVCDQKDPVKIVVCDSKKIVDGGCGIIIVTDKGRVFVPLIEIAFNPEWTLEEAKALLKNGLEFTVTKVAMVMIATENHLYRKLTKGLKRGYFKVEYWERTSPTALPAPYGDLVGVSLFENIGACVPIVHSKVFEETP